MAGWGALGAMQALGPFSLLLQRNPLPQQQVLSFGGKFLAGNGFLWLPSKGKPCLGLSPRGPAMISTRLPRSRVGDARTQFRSFTPHSHPSSQKGHQNEGPLNRWRSVSYPSVLWLVHHQWTFQLEAYNSESSHWAALDTLSLLTPEDAAVRGGQKWPAGLANHQEWCGSPLTCPGAPPLPSWFQHCGCWLART